MLWTLHRLTDISTAAARRYRAEVLIPRRDRADIVLYSLIAGMLRDLRKRPDVDDPARPHHGFGRSAAGVVYVFAYDDESLIGTGTTVARGQYVSSKLDCRFRPLPLPGGRARRQIGNDLIVLDWGSAAGAPARMGADR